MAEVVSRRPPWVVVPLRVGATTFLLTLLSFAVALLLSILGTVVYSQIRHMPPDLPLAYRHIAFPFAILVGSLVFVASLMMEIRYYRKGPKPATFPTSEPGTVSTPRIAIAIPHSGDREYAERALPPYEEGVRLSGGEPVRIELDQPPAQVMKQIESCDAVLLPGSRADIDPQKYGAPRHSKTAPADARRDTVDELLLQDAYNMRKPIFGICYGLQSLNVYRSGSLVQHIESEINHSPGRTVANAHSVEVEPESLLAKIVSSAQGETAGKSPAPIAFGVTSSHHQSADVVGDGLRVVARCPDDGIIEAVEGTAPGHFVLAVQWHPERSLHESEELSVSARALFRAFVDAARARHAELSGEFESSRRG